jgi:hypothetical protein
MELSVSLRTESNSYDVILMKILIKLIYVSLILRNVIACMGLDVISHIWKMGERRLRMEMVRLEVDIDKLYIKVEIIGKAGFLQLCSKNTFVDDFSVHYFYYIYGFIHIFLLFIRLS